MSQQLRRIPLDEFLRQAPSLLEEIATHGETLLLEHNGRFFTLSAYQAYRKRSQPRPQPPNMQDSLWSYTRATSVAQEPNGASPPPVAKGPAGVAPRPAGSRQMSEPGHESQE